MKYCNQSWKRQVDDTDIEDSLLSRPVNKIKKRAKRVPKFKRKLKRLAVTALYLVLMRFTQKILRFRAKNSKKTFRVYCYDEDSLGWPYRFTKKINKMVKIY